LAANHKLTEYYGSGAKPEIKMYPKNSPKKQTLDLKLGLMIAIDYQPYQIVENKWFVQFIKELNLRYQLPCHWTVNRFSVFYYAYSEVFSQFFVLY